MERGIKTALCSFTEGTFSNINLVISSITPPEVVGRQLSLSILILWIS